MKEFLKKLKDLKSDKEDNQKSRMILFFGFYFIFFAIVICLIVFGGNRQYLTQEYEKGQPSIGNGLGDSFSYTYHIQVDDLSYDYVGEQTGNFQLFTFQEKEYFFNGEKYYLKEETWNECENPYLYREFYDIETFVKIIEKSTYVAKTEYENGDVIYHYLVSSNDLNELFFAEKTEYENSSNTIDITIDANRHITGIVYGLDDYGTHREMGSRFSIEIHYAQYGEIKEIENPTE